MNFSKHYCAHTPPQRQRVQAVPLPPGTFVERANGFAVRGRLPQARAAAEEGWRGPAPPPCDRHPPRPRFVHLAPLPPEPFAPEPFGDMHLHLVMKVTKFRPEEITVTATASTISIDCKRDERADEEGGWASYHYVRRVSVPPEIDLRYMVTWVTDGVLNVRAPYAPAPEPYGGRITVRVCLDSSDDRSRPRNPGAVARAGAQPADRDIVAEMSSAFRDMAVRPPAVPWSMGINGSVLRPRDDEPDRPELEDRPVRDVPEDAPGETNPVAAHVEPSPDAEGTAEAPRPGDSLEDLSYEVVGPAKVESDPDAAPRDPTDG